MKRKFLVLLSMLLILALACTACNTNKGNNDCEHTYSDKWSTNSTEHWHAATCEHAELKSDVAAHADANQDSKCDVCDYEIGHEHTYADAWSSNETHHWKAATCSHTNEKGYLAAHTDTDFDTFCDECNAILKLEMPTDVASAVEILASRAGAINGGTLLHHYIGRNHVGVDVESAKNVSYVFGSNSLHMVVESWAKQPNDFTEDLDDYVEDTDTLKGWFELLSADTVFAVTQTIYDGETSDYELNTGADASIMGGFNCAVSTLADAYGPENLLVTLYNLAQSNAASNYVVAFDENARACAFTFNYLYVNSENAEGEGDHVDYYEVLVSFTYSENGALTALNVVADCYTNSLENEEDNDYTYNQLDGTITMKENALADTYTFAFTQTVGRRTYVNENSQSKFVPTDYDFFSDMDCTNALNGTITVNKEESGSIFVGAFVPAASDIIYVADTVTYNADESLNLWYYGNQIGFYAKATGTYTVEFTVAGVTKTFTIVVKDGSAGDGDVSVGENEFSVKTTETYDAYMTDRYTFVAPGSGEYTFYIPAGLGLWSVESISKNQFGTPEVDYYDNIAGDTVVVELAEGDEYSFYVAAITKGTWVISYSYIYREVESNQNSGSALKDAQGLGGEYKIDWIMPGIFVLTFTPDGAGSRTGTLVVVDNATSKNGGTFTYTIENGVYLLFDSTNMITTAVSIYKEGSNWYFKNASCPNGVEFAEVSSGNVATTVVAGTYVSNAGHATLRVIVTADTITFDYNSTMLEPSTATYTYEVVDGAVVLYDEEGNKLNPMAGQLEVNAEGIPVSAYYNGSNYAF